MILCLIVGRVIMMTASNHNNQQMNLNHIEEIICQALLVSDNNKVRSQAEAQIYQLVKENYSDFFLALAQIISDEQKKLFSRQSTASVFKRLLAFRDQHNTYFWDRVHENVRHTIKEMLLSTLIDQEATIMRAGANAIAQIASIEIPRGEWLGIVNTLAQNAQHEEYTIRRASIITLGYICQQLKNMKCNIDSETCKQILGSLLLGLEKEGDIVEVSLNALRDSVPFLRNILENIQFCNKAFQFIMPHLNQDHRSRVYEFLFQFCKYCYHISNNYLQMIIKFTVQHMRNRNQDSINALSLWETIGTEYIERHTDMKERVNENNQQLANLVLAAQRQILPEIMSLLLIVNPRDNDTPELRQSAVQTLTVVVECGDREMVDTITAGVANLLQSSKPGQRQATVLLFGCLCSYPDKDYIYQKFTQGFLYFYKLLNDGDIIVVKNTLNGFITLSESFPDVFMTHCEIKQIFMHLLNMGKSQDETLRVLSLSVLANITESLSKYPQPIATEPKQILTDLVQMFQMNLKSNMNRESNEKLIIVLMNIVMSTNNMAIVSELVSHLITQYQYFAGLDVQDKAIILQHIITVIHTCLLAISKASFTKPQLKDMVFNLIDQHIQINGVEAEGINMISAASTCYRKEFKNKIDFYWQKILHGLSLIDQKQIFTTTLTCISDISRVHEQDVIDKLNKVFQMLVGYMHQNIDRELKTEILKCFGDLTLGMKRYCQGYVDTLLEIIGNCFQAVYTFSQQESEKGYAEDLKQALIEMYHCLVFALNDQNNCNLKMANHFPLISTFIVQSCAVKYKPTVDYLRQCLYLIYDSGLFYSNNAQFKTQVYSILQSKQVKGLIETIHKYNDRQDIRDLLLFIQDKLRIR